MFCLILEKIEKSYTFLKFMYHGFDSPDIKDVVSWIRNALSDEEHPICSITELLDY